MVVNSNVAPFKSEFIGSLLGAIFQGVNDTVADVDPIRNGAQIGYNQLNSSLSARRQWKYYQKQASLDHQYNLATMERAAEIARDQYDYEFQMESPAMRVAQFQQAGLNKGLMYSNGVAGMQGSVGSGSPVSSRGQLPNTKDSFNKPTASAIGSALSALSQNKANNAVADANTALADKYQAEAGNTRVDTLLKQKDVLLRELDIEGKRIQNAKSDDERKFLKSSYDKKLRQLDLINIQIEQETKTSASQEHLNIEQADTESSKRYALESQGQRDLSQADWNDVRRILDESYGDRERSTAIGKVEAEISKLRSEPDLIRSLTELNDKRNEYTEKDFYLRVGTLILNALHGRRSNNITEQHYKNTDNKSRISVENVITLARILLPYLLKAV